jgi:hypothetical protein
MNFQGANVQIYLLIDVIILLWLHYTDIIILALAILNLLIKNNVTYL